MNAGGRLFLESRLQMAWAWARRLLVLALCMVPTVSGSAARVIASVRQLDLACPTARSCPGTQGVEYICNRLKYNELFRCGLTWSTGASGFITDDPPFVRAFVVGLLSEMCGACADTLSLSTSFDVNVEIPVE